MRVLVQQKIIKRKDYRVIIIIGILLFQFIIIFVDADPSQGRWGHTSVLINNRLYVYGGKTDQTAPQTVNTSNINELLYLDLSKSFDPEDPKWKVENLLLTLGDGTSIPPPNLAFHSSNSGGSQNELLILFGGQLSQFPIEDLLFAFNTTSGTWLSPSVIANGPSRRDKHTMVTKLGDPVAYLWGGTPVNSREDNTALNDLYRLTFTDSTMLWEQLDADSAPSGRWDHSATFLNNGKMYIIGGASTGDELAPMTDIPVYDTIAGSWKTLTATGDLPNQRRAHRAVATTDNRIIIYGGTTAVLDTKFDDVAVLNITNDTLTWTKPTMIGTTPPGRYAHSMTLVGTKAIVSYGFVDNFTGRSLFVFDTNSYTWETAYDAPSEATNGVDISPTENQNNHNHSNSGIVIGVSVGAGVIVLLLIGLLLFFCKKRRKQHSFSATPYDKQQASIPPIAGPAPSHNLNNYGLSSPSQGGTGGTQFIPPFATSSRRQPSLGSLNEPRNLTPVDQHDSWGSAPSNSSQSQLPQIRPSTPKSPTATSPYLMNTSNIHYSSPPTSPHYSNTPPTPPRSTPTPPRSTPTPPPVSSQKIFGTKTSSSNLRLDSDSNTAPVEFDFNLPPVAPLSLSINRTRTPSPSQAQTQVQQQQPQLPISTSTSSSSSSLPQGSSNLVSSLTKLETTTTSTEDEGETSGSFNSPLFRTEALSAFAGIAATADRPLSLRSVPRLNTQSTPRNSTGLSSPSPISATSRLRSGALDGQRTYSYDGNVTNGSRPTSPEGRLFVANPDPSNGSD